MRCAASFVRCFDSALRAPLNMTGCAGEQSRCLCHPERSRRISLRVRCYRVFREMFRLWLRTPSLLPRYRGRTTLNMTGGAGASHWSVASAWSVIPRRQGCAAGFSLCKVTIMSRISHYVKERIVVIRFRRRRIVAACSPVVSVCTRWRRIVAVPAMCV